MRVLIAFVCLGLYSVSVNAAGSTEDCPAPASTDIVQACTYDVRQFGHFRNCSVDIYMSLCALRDPANADWQFICTNPNYCLGCRYGYNNCVNQSSVDDQTFYLAWFDGMVLGGKYSLCDMGQEYVTTTLRTDACMLDTTIATTIEGCAIQYMQLFQGTNSNTDLFTCSNMNDAVHCFLDTLDGCADKASFNIYQRYFRGVVSLTQCQGSIYGLGAGSTTAASLALLLLAAIFLALFS